MVQGREHDCVTVLHRCTANSNSISSGFSIRRYLKKEKKRKFSFVEAQDFSTHPRIYMCLNIFVLYYERNIYVICRKGNHDKVKMHNYILHITYYVSMGIKNKHIFHRDS